MANSLDMDLKGKKVVMKGDGPESERTILVEDGFGASSFTAGTAVFGIHIATGKHIRVSGMEIAKLVE